MNKVPTYLIFKKTPANCAIAAAEKFVLQEWTVRHHPAPKVRSTGIDRSEWNYYN